FLAIIVQIAGVEASHYQARIFGKNVCAASQDKELSRSKRGSVGENKIDAGTEAEASHVERVGTCVLELKELIQLTVIGPEFGRIIHQFRDQEFRKVLGDKKFCFHEGAPGIASGVDASANRQALVEGDRSRITDRGWRNGAAALAR